VADFQSLLILSTAAVDNFVGNMQKMPLDR